MTYSLTPNINTLIHRSRRWPFVKPSEGPSWHRHCAHIPVFSVCWMCWGRRKSPAQKIALAAGVAALKSGQVSESAVPLEDPLAGRVRVDLLPSCCSNLTRWQPFFRHVSKSQYELLMKPRTYSITSSSLAIIDICSSVIMIIARIQTGLLFVYVLLFFVLHLD